MCTPKNLLQGTVVYFLLLKSSQAPVLIPPPATTAWEKNQETVTRQLCPWGLTVENILLCWEQRFILLFIPFCMASLLLHVCFIIYALCITLLTILLQFSNFVLFFYIKLVFSVILH